MTRTTTVEPSASGGRRSEVKEEGRAQPGPGDMSEGGRPMPLARGDLPDAMSRLARSVVEQLI
jgi:hypothetical protein